MYKEQAQSRTTGPVVFIFALLEAMAWHGLYNFSLSSGAVPFWFILGFLALLRLRVSSLIKREKTDRSLPPQS